MYHEIETLQAQVDSLTTRLENATSAPSNNTIHGSVRSAVLSSKRPKIGFDKDAWKPPSGDVEETPEKPIKAGFDREAWAPPNAEDTKE